MRFKLFLWWMWATLGKMKEEMGRDIKVLKSLESWGKMKNQGSLVTLMTRG